MKVALDKDKNASKKKMNKRQRKMNVILKKKRIEEKKKRIALHFEKFKPKTNSSGTDSEIIDKSKALKNKSKSKPKLSKFKEPKVKKTKIVKSILKKSPESKGNTTASESQDSLNIKDEVSMISKKRKIKPKKKVKELKKLIDDKEVKLSVSKKSEDNLLELENNAKSVGSEELNTKEDKITIKEKVKKKRRRKVPTTNDNWNKLKEVIREEIVKLLPPPCKFVRTERTGSARSKERSNRSVANGNEVWFDGIDPILLGNGSEDLVEGSLRDMEAKLITDPTDNSVTKAVGLDCEMVGVGMNGSESMLARVSIVNHFGNVLYDKYVKPQEEVIDYRTEFSGIRPSDLVDALPFATVQNEVTEFIRGRILVGHELSSDLKCLFLPHPKDMRRDTARYKPFRHINGGGKPSLKKLAKLLLSLEIQTGEHDSVIDAKAAMRMYTLNKKEWESLIKKNKGGYKKGMKHDKVQEDADNVESED